MKNFEHKKIFIILTIVMVVINGSLIFNNNVWCDEAFIINATKLDFVSLLKYIATDDMRPPLYLISIKLWTMLCGDSVAAFKLFSIVPAVLTMCVCGRLVNKFFGEKSASLFILLVGLTPSSMTKNIEITIYSWSLFWVTTSLLLAYQLYKEIDNKKISYLFIISSLGAAATHYYALVAIAFIYMVLFICLWIKGKNKRIIGKIIVLSIIGYIPCLPFFLIQFFTAKKSFWIQKVDLSIFPQTMRMPFEGENAFKFSNEFTAIIWIMIIFLLIVQIQRVKSYRNESDVFSILSFGLFLIIPLSGYLISAVLRPLYVERYFYCVTGVLWLFISIAINSFETKNKSNNVYYLMLSFVITIFIFAYPVIYDREYTKETQKTVDMITASLERDDIFINNIERCASWELEYYFPGHEYYLNHDEGIYYKDEVYDFSQLKKTAWYICQGDFDLNEEELKKLGISCEYIGWGNFDNYYYVSVYKLTPDKIQRGGK